MGRLTQYNEPYVQLLFVKKSSTFNNLYKEICLNFYFLPFHSEEKMNLSENCLNRNELVGILVLLFLLLLDFKKYSLNPSSRKNASIEKKFWTIQPK